MKFEDNKLNQNYLNAQKRVKEIKGFYWNLFWYLAINISWLVVVLYLDGAKSFVEFGFWRKGYGLIVNAVFWGIGLLVQWFIVFGRNFTFSKKWEERKIKQLMEKDEY